MSGPQPQRFAFVSPQGTMVLADDRYVNEQGKTAENGGQVIYVVEMAQALAAQGHEVCIFARNYDSREIVEETHPHYPGIRVYHIPTSADHSIEKEHFYPYYPEYAANALKAIEDNNLQIDSFVGHYADGMFLSAVIEDCLNRRTGVSVPLMGITHSLGMEKAESLYKTLEASNTPGGSFSLKSKYEDAVKHYNIEARLGCELAAISRLDGIGCISPAHLACLYNEYKYPEDQMRLLPGGINEDVFKKTVTTDAEKTALRRRLVSDMVDDGKITADGAQKINDGKIVFGFGRLVAAKGIVSAVKSMGHLLEKAPDAVYIYAGGNIPLKTAEEHKVYNEAMDYAKAHGYADRIFFLGRQNQKTISDWLNAADVYLHAAYLEPFGLAPQEAAATGIPVVLSKYAGAGYVLRNNELALHTDPHSPPDIAKQVGRLLRNQSLAKDLSGRAHQLINDTCTWAARAKHLAAFSREVKTEYFPQRAELPKGVYHAGHAAAARVLLTQNIDAFIHNDETGWADTVYASIEELVKERAAAPDDTQELLQKFSSNKDGAKCQPG